MYISSNIARQRTHTITTVYNLTSYEYQEPSHATLFMFNTGSISYSGGVTAFDITRQQAANILAHAHDADWRIVKKHITETDVRHIWTHESTRVHPKNPRAHSLTI